MSGFFQNVRSEAPQKMCVVCYHQSHWSFFFVRSPREWCNFLERPIMESFRKELGTRIPSSSLREIVPFFLVGSAVRREKWLALPGPSPLSIGFKLFSKLRSIAINFILGRNRFRFSSRRFEWTSNWTRFWARVFNRIISSEGCTPGP